VALLDWQLANKTVIVTGASSGIGAETARMLGSAGASVVLAGRNRERLDAVARDVEAEGGKTHIVEAELTDIAQAEGVVAQAVEAFGSLHGIAHLASVFDPRPLADTTLESLEV
jgi:NAD(P)-dependent dehydrogenase (short-subunit alcohol dehydrogenase family)